MEARDTSSEATLGNVTVWDSEGGERTCAPIVAKEIVAAGGSWEPPAETPGGVGGDEGLRPWPLKTSPVEYLDLNAEAEDPSDLVIERVALARQYVAAGLGDFRK